MFWLGCRLFRFDFGKRMSPLGRIFRGTVSFTLLGNNMEEVRSLEILDILQGCDQRFDIVTIGWPHVIETQFIKQSAWNHHALHMFFRAFGNFPCMGNPAKNFFAALTH